MSDEPTNPEQPESSAPAKAQEPEWRRRRRLDAVFGDVLPDTTSDEREASEGRTGDETPGDRWLRGQVPPHHG